MRWAAKAFNSISQDIIQHCFVVCNLEVGTDSEKADNFETYPEFAEITEIHCFTAGASFKDNIATTEEFNEEEVTNKILKDDNDKEDETPSNSLDTEPEIHLSNVT